MNDAQQTRETLAGRWEEIAECILSIETLSLDMIACPEEVLLQKAERRGALVERIRALHTACEGCTPQDEAEAARIQAAKDTARAAVCRMQEFCPARVCPGPVYLARFYCLIPFRPVRFPLSCFRPGGVRSPLQDRERPPRSEQRGGLLGYRFGVRRNHVTGFWLRLHCPVTIVYPKVTCKILRGCEQFVNLRLSFSGSVCR